MKAYTESLVVQDCIAWILRVIAYTSCYYAVPDDYFAFGVISFLLLSTVQYPLFEALFRTCISILPSQLHKSPKVSRPAADKCVRFSPLTQSRIFAPTERTSPMNPRDPAVGAPLIPADQSPVERCD